MRRPLLLVAGAAVVLALPWLFSRAEAPDAPQEHPSPWALAATSDGRTLFASCGGLGYVARVDVEEHRVADRWRLAATPRGLAVSPDDAVLAVSLGLQDRILLLDARTGAERARLVCVGAPEGLAFSADGRRLFAACRHGEDVAVLDLEKGEVERRLPAGREPFAAAISPDGRSVAVVSRRAAIVEPDAMSWAEVTVVDAESRTVRHAVRLPTCHLSEAAAFTRDSRYLLVPAIRVRNLLPLVQVARGWVLSSVLAVVDVTTGDVWSMPLQYADQGFADPTGLAVSDDGRRAYVAAGGVDEVGVIDLPALLSRLPPEGADAPEDFGITREYVIARRPVGDNPRGVVWLGRGPYGDVAVSNRLDDDLHLLDREGDVRARLPFEWTIPDDAVHRGRRAFFDARYCFQDMFSCTSCHPEGHTDGLTYDFEIDGVGRNPVLNRSLLGLEGTDPYKWTGINPSLQNQCGARFAMVLTRARSFPPDVLDDMAAFVLSLPPPRPKLLLEDADEATRASVERGRRLFARSRAKDGRRLRPGERCITCHPPPNYTNRQRTDVGTRGPLDDDDTFDVPHLTGTGTKAPYLHDGRALSLEAVLRTLGDRHGHVSDLSDEDVEDLVRFLESL